MCYNQKAMLDIKSLVEKLKPLNPEKIILFGSYAKGKSTAESDIDVLIVKRTAKRPVERIAEVLKFVWGSIPHVEPYVLTPKEFEKAVEEKRYFLTQEILPHGKVIYEK